MANYLLQSTEAIQDYAKAIYSLQGRQDGLISTSAIAHRVEVSPASATAMIKRMAKLKLVSYEPYKGVSLTAAGESIALETMRHHRLIELYLAKALDMPWDRVHAEAEVLEHYISEDLEEMIAQKLSDPELDPHGDPIPDRSLNMPHDKTSVLADLKPGDSGVFKRVSDSDPAMLRYLAERDILPGAKFVVESKEPFDGPMYVKFDGHVHALGGRLVRSMRVATS